MWGGRKGVILPGAELIKLPAVSERDRADLRFGVEQGVDMVYASFIRSAQDVRAVRDALGPDGKKIKIISKVENRQGVQKGGREREREREREEARSFSLSHAALSKRMWLEVLESGPF